MKAQRLKLTVETEQAKIRLEKLKEEEKKYADRVEQRRKEEEALREQKERLRAEIDSSQQAVLLRKNAIHRLDAQYEETKRRTDLDIAKLNEELAKIRAEKERVTRAQPLQAFFMQLKEVNSLPPNRGQYYLACVHPDCNYKTWTRGEAQIHVKTHYPLAEIL